MLQSFGKRRICSLFNPLLRQNLIILHFSTFLNKSQLAPSSERFITYNYGTVGASSNCHSELRKVASTASKLAKPTKAN